MNKTNITPSKTDTLLEDPLNSFQMNTPQSAATSVAPWPSP